MYQVVQRKSGDVMVIRKPSADDKKRGVKVRRVKMILSREVVAWVSRTAIEKGKPEEIDFLHAIFLGFGKLVSRDKKVSSSI